MWKLEDAFTVLELKAASMVESAFVTQPNRRGKINRSITKKLPGCGFSRPNNIVYLVVALQYKLFDMIHTNFESPVQSTCRLLIYWLLFGTRAFATIMVTSVGRSPRFRRHGRTKRFGSSLSQTTARHNGKSDVIQNGRRDLAKTHCTSTDQ